MKKLAIWTPALKWLFIGISAAQLTCLFKSGDEVRPLLKRYSALSSELCSSSSA